MRARLRSTAAALWWVAAPLASLASAADSTPVFAPESVEFFEKKIRPILVESCYNCHSANTNAKGELRVDDRGGLLTGGNNGPAVVPGKPEESLLLQAVLHADGVPRMPPKTKLAPEQVADLTRWIAEGAAWPPVAEATSTASSQTSTRYEELRRNHWAWQPNRNPAPPAVRDAAWPRTDVDRFVLARLEAEGLAPVGDADRVALIRRVTFDLTGLPPAPAEVAAFEANEAAPPQALAAVVDRLLASPAFGEKWGRHWLDVARFGESTGSSRNVPYPHAWRYRDYVIDSFNADKSYRTFLREQIAGDLLPAATPAQRVEQQVATGFLALGVKDVNQRFKVRFVMDNVDEQIDTVSRSVLGLTVSCARCHDHKFDPVPAADYYAWAGIFTSTDLCAGVRNKMGGGGLDYYDPTMLISLAEPSTPDPDHDGKVAAATKAYEAARKEFQKIQGTPEGLALGPNGQPRQRPFRQKMIRLQAELAALTDPSSSGPVALGVRDAKTTADTAIRIRGEAEKLGRIVPRGFLSLLGVADARPIAVGQAPSGRLELADWLANDQNPLTARVLVNRVWGHLFGQGIVASVDNFGVTGAAPSHPELLDHLSARFVADGWSIKQLIRTIVLSRAYQLGSEATERHLELDPADRWIWRHAPRRLDAEEIRDATLTVAGQLDRARPEASPTKTLKVMELPNNGALAVGIRDQARASRHRSLYLPLLRGVTPTSLEVFDFAEQGMVTGQRDSTTVATQALYLMNDPFVRRQALNLAEYLIQHEGRDSAARINLAYRLALSRPATATEIARVQTFLVAYEPAAAVVLAQTARPPEPTRPVPAPATSTTEGDAPPKKPTPPIDPDEVIQVDAPVVEEEVRPRTAEAAAWAGFCQALLGSAEFRYVR